MMTEIRITHGTATVTSFHIWQCIYEKEIDGISQMSMLMKKRKVAKTSHIQIYASCLGPEY